MSGRQRVLVLNAGGVPDRKTTRFELPFKEDAELTSYRDVNTGDTLVLDSILTILKASEFKSAQFGQDLTSLLNDWGQPDIAVVRGSNYIHESYEPESFIPALETLKCPIVSIGVGAQAPTFKPLKLSNGMIRFLHFLRDRSHSIGVRGTYTAEVLESVGVKSSFPIGCPSFFRSLSPSIHMKPLPKDRIRIGASFNRFLGSYYCSNFVKTYLLQAELMKNILARHDSSIYWQGEKEELYFARHPEAETIIDKVLGRYEIAATEESRREFHRKLKVYTEISGWSQHIRENCDAMIGFRLHGNVMGLNQGIPSLMYSYDSRTRELANFFSLPVAEVEDFAQPDPEQLFLEADFTHFETTYAANYQSLLQFLESNGLEHNLTPMEAPSSAPRKCLRVGEPSKEWLKLKLDHTAKMYNDLLEHHLRIRDR
jgi:hypothetical protein